MLRGGIIGLGNVGIDAHLPALARCRDVVIAGVTDAVAARRAVVEPILSGARWYDSAEAMIAGADLDFVDICTPPSTHGRLIKVALERGLHVLCEKPLVGSLAELTALTRVATARHRVLHTVHNWHHAPIVHRTWQLVREGAIGRVSRVVWKTLRTHPAATRDDGNGNWRLDPAVAGGGVLTDHGWHVFYIVPSWIGERPVTVSARLETRRHTRSTVEDTATVHVTFPHATADVLLTWAAEARDNQAELTGTAGSIHLEDTVLTLRRGDGETRWTIEPGLSNGSVHLDWFHPVVDRFVSSVIEGRLDGSNLREASVCAAIESSARESSRRGGRAVPLAPAALAL